MKVTKLFGKFRHSSVFLENSQNSFPDLSRRLFCFVFIRHLLSCKAEISATWQHRRRGGHVDRSRGMAQQWPGHPNQLFADAVAAVAATAAAHSHYDSSPRHNVRSYMSLHTVRILLQVKAGWLRYCNMKQSTLHYASSCMKSTDALVPWVPAVSKAVNIKNQFLQHKNMSITDVNNARGSR